MAKYFKCPYCDKKFERTKLAHHIEKNHIDLLPEGFTPLRMAFNAINYPNNLDYCGRCTECKGPTAWDENKGRYDRQCSRKECRESYLKRFEDNMMRTKGVKRITQTVNGQEKMLANRSISHKYTFQDGGVKIYTGSYEGKLAEFLDKVMNYKSIDIQMPGPVLEYEYNGEKHIYISDSYIIPYNLIIEVKDGGDNPNTRNMPEYRAKQIAKEKHIINNTNYNYIRLTNNDFTQLLAVLSDLKLQLVENTGERVIHINENMFAAMQGMMPMPKSNDVYIINRLQNNIFSDESDFMISDSPKFDRVFYRDSDGVLKEGNASVLEEGEYNLYIIKDCMEGIEEAIKKNIEQFVEEGFIYETVFKKKLYTPDQIKFEERALETVDLFTYLKETMEMVHEYTMGKGNYIHLPKPYNESQYLDTTTGNIVEATDIGGGNVIECNNFMRQYITTYLKGIGR